MQTKQCIVLRPCHRICEPDVTVDALLACDVCGPWMDLSVERHHTSGEILDISEVRLVLFRVLRKYVQNTDLLPMLR